MLLKLLSSNDMLWMTWNGIYGQHVAIQLFDVSQIRHVYHTKDS